MTAIALACTAPSSARAQEPPASERVQTAPDARTQGSGVAVVAIGAPLAAGAAWPLAQSVYASAALRPAAVDEAHARVLAGEAPPPNAPRELRDLAETRAALRGDDAPSRAILGSIANTFHLRGIVAVEMSADAKPIAHVFLADTGAFDAARYEPDRDASDASNAPRWSGAVASLERSFAASGPIQGIHAPALATTPVPGAGTAGSPAATTRQTGATKGEERGAHHPFYTSPWFWGAVGAAAFGGAAVYFATRDNGPDTIHLQMQVPK
jgi:hypothetical protein